MNKNRNRTYVVCVLLFALAAAPRLAYVLISDRHGSGAEMERAAISLASNGTLANIYGPDTGPSAHVAPLYAVVLSLLYRTFGMPNVSGRLAQMVLAVFVTSSGIALLPVLGKRLRLHPWAGPVAGFLMALSPVNLWIECTGSWEQPYAALALLGLVLSFATLHACLWQSRILELGVGLLVGLTALLCPSILPAVALMLAAEFLGQAGNRRSVLHGAAVILAVAGLCVAPWLIRNYRELGGLVVLRSNFGLELWVGNNPAATGRTFGTHADDPDGLLGLIHPYSNSLEKADLKSIGELAYMRKKLHMAEAWIMAHPETFYRLTLQRVRLYWFPPADMWTPSTPARFLKSTLWCLVSLGTFFGLAYFIGTRQPYAWLLLAGIVGPALIYFITHVDTRYRYPSFALSVLLASQAGLLMLQFAMSYIRTGRTSPQFARGLPDHFMVPSASVMPRQDY